MSSSRKSSKQKQKQNQTPEQHSSGVEGDMWNSLVLDTAQHNIPFPRPPSSYMPQQHFARPQGGFAPHDQDFGYGYGGPQAGGFVGYGPRGVFGGYGPSQGGFGGYANQQGGGFGGPSQAGFGNPHKQPNNPPSQGSQPEVEGVQETQFDTEEVEETQTPVSKGKGKRAKVMWSDDESRILAECWARATTDNIIGNSQTNGTFWSTVREEYNSLATPRRQDQLTGKWSKMYKDIKLFIAIYDKLKEHWRSGENDADIIKHAKKSFKLQSGRIFVYEDAWNTLKDCPQFLTYEGFNNKRGQPDTINLEDPDPNPTPTTNVPNLEPLFRGDPIRRPRGRDTSKAAKSSGSSDAASRLSSEEARARVIDSSIATRETMEELRKEAQTRTKFDGLRLLSQEVSTNIPQEQYDLVMKYRNKLTKKYLAEYKSDDEE